MADLPVSALLLPAHHPRIRILQSSRNVNIVRTLGACRHISAGKYDGLFEVNWVILTILRRLFKVQTKKYKQ
jgi:hypothetical protein